MSFSIPIRKKVYSNTARSKKEYVTYNLKLIDSARHVNDSLERLVDNLSEIKKFTCDDKSFKNIKVTYGKFNYRKIIRTTCKTCKSRQDQQYHKLISKFPNTFKLCRNNVEKSLLLLRKGVYAYEYMNSTDKFIEKSYPLLISFILNSKVIVLALMITIMQKKVWDLFKLNNLGEYHDLYVCADTAQLSDVFENFRYLCLRDFELDPAYFLLSPSLAFEAMLKTTKARVELFTDIDMILMAEKAIRGGLTQVVKRHAAANHKYLPAYDKSKKCIFLQYLDANNLYGYGMSQKLPLDGYKWANALIVTDKFVKDYDINSDKGYLLEGDVEYPVRLRIYHKELPFLPERRVKSVKYDYDDLSSAHRKVYKTFNMNPEPNNKLIATVQDKNKYIVHISTLKQALQHGLRSKKVDRVIEFIQSTWLEPYIRMNTEFRKAAKNDFEKSFFKLMNNAVFGKMIENVKKRRDIRLITNKDRRKKLVSEPKYASCTPFSTELMAVEMRKIRIYMEKPTLVNQAILDKSNELMYSFCYD